MNKQSINKPLNLALSNKDTLFTLSNINSVISIRHTIASLFFIKYDLIIDILNLRNNLNISPLNIFLISSDVEYSENTDNEPTILIVRTISIAKFKEIVSSDMFNEFNPNSLYILQDIKWNEIIKLFITCKPSITISGGSAGKRHVISNMQNRLILYFLSFVDLDYNKVNFYNNFNSVDKENYLPYFDFSNKNQLRKTESSGYIAFIDKNTSKTNEDI